VDRFVALSRLSVAACCILVRSCIIRFLHAHLLSFRSEQPPNEGGGEDAAAEGGGLTDADFDSNWDESIDTFDAMELPEELLRGIYSYGFEKPSAIQQRAIKPTMMGRDLIAQAQSGTVRVLKICRVQWLKTNAMVWCMAQP
jgi:hypothetical protein